MYKEIQFAEEDHKYFDDKGVVYTSATTLISQYQKQYDQDFWSMYTALKENDVKVRPEPEARVIWINGIKYPMSLLKKDEVYKNWQQMVLFKWKAITAQACLRGNNIHNYLEDTINDSKSDYKGATNKDISPDSDKINIKFNKDNNIETIHDLDKTDLNQTYPSIYNRLSKYINAGWIIYAEKRMHLEKYRVAGMIDVPIIKGKKFCIMDWKSNKDELKTQAGYYKKKKVNGVWQRTDEFIATGDSFQYPIAHVEQSKFNIYALQLSLYAYMMEEWGYELANNGLEIVHIRPNKSPILIKIPYMKREIKMMLQHHYENKIQIIK